MKLRVIEKATLVLLSIGVLGGAAQAQVRLFAGARNMGMGNTGVASTTDALSVHFNPAGMAFNHGWEIQLPLITAEAEVVGDVINNIDRIQDLFEQSSLNEIQARLDAGTAGAQDLSTVLDAFLYRLPEISSTGSGAQVSGLAGPAFRWKNWGVSASFLGNGGVDTSIDLQNGISLSSIGLGWLPAATTDCGGDPFCVELAGAGSISEEQARTLIEAAGAELQGNPEAQQLLTDIVTATTSGDTTLANNESAVITSTFLAQQYAFTYSHMVARDKVSLGANVRVLVGEVDRTSTTVANFEEGDETLENAFDNLGDGKTSTEFALDIGVMYRPFRKLTLGLVGRNLNSPEFEIPLGKYELQTLARGGVAYRPFKWFNFAVDVDLNETDSQLIREFDYRYVNLGTEFLIGRWFQGWLGAYQNVAESATEPTYTGGLGFGIGRFQIALGLAVSGNEVNISSGEDEETFPTGAAAAFSLAWRPGREPS